MSSCVRSPRRVEVAAIVLAGLVATCGANAADVSLGAAQATDSVLAKKLKLQEQELKKQSRDIEALQAEVHTLLSAMQQTQLAQAQSKRNSVRKIAAQQPPANPAQSNGTPAKPVLAMAAPQPEDRVPVDVQVAHLETAFLDDIRAGQSQSGSSAQIPAQPVGQQPEPPKKLPDTTALPEQANLLTPPGAFIFTPSVEYTRSSTNALVFNGIELVPGLQLGIVNDTNVSQDTAIATADLRAGLLDRLELEVKVPWVARGDRETLLSQQTSTSTAPATITTNTTGDGLGDIEGSLRYQLNGDVQQDDPVYIVSLRVKSNSGVGPYDVRFGTGANQGVAESLATGTGFWGIGPGFVVLVPSDPAVLFVNGSYLHSFSHDEDKTIGTTLVGNVTPGDSIQLGMGFGLAVNSKFDFSLGYSQTAILPTTQVLSGSKFRSTTLQAGQLTLGASYAVTPDFVLNTQFLFGVTSDAPNMDVTFRLPVSLGPL